MAAAPHGEPRPRRFAPTEHLSSEAVAAFADDRLQGIARDRALRHLGMCPECLEAVHVQRSARYALRQSGPVRIPGDLADRLCHLDDCQNDRRTRPRRSAWRRLVEWLGR